MEIKGTNGPAPHMSERLGNELQEPTSRARSASSGKKRPAREDQTALLCQQERTRRLIMAAVKLWEIRRGFTD
jgi:hypothetical protein